MKTEGATAVFDEIQKRFGGQAQAQLDTYSGKTAALGNKMDDLREKVGELMTRALTPLIDTFLELPEPVQTILLGAGALVVVLGPIAIGFGAIATAVGPLIPMLAAALPVALGALSTLLGPAGLLLLGIGAVVAAWRNWDAIVGFAKAVYDGVKHWMVDQFSGIVESVKDKVKSIIHAFGDAHAQIVAHSSVPDLIKGIAFWFDKLDTVMVDPAKAATDKVQGLFSGLGDKLGAMLGGNNSTFGKIMNGGLGSLFGAGGPLMSLVGMGMEAIGGLVMKGISKIGSWIGGLFGGGEIAKFVNPERDKWFAGREVGDIGNALGPFMDGEEARKMIERVFNAKTRDELSASTSAIDKILGRAHLGGLIGAHGLERFHTGGLFGDERLVIGQTGEGILNRRAMQQLGEGNFHALNRGKAPGPTVIFDPTLRAEVKGLRADITRLYRQLPEQLVAASMSPRLRG